MEVTCKWKLTSLFYTGVGQITTHGSVYQRKDKEEIAWQNNLLFHPPKPQGVSKSGWPTGQMNRNVHDNSD